MVVVVVVVGGGGVRRALKVIQIHLEEGCVRGLVVGPVVLLLVTRIAVVANDVGDCFFPHGCSY